MIKTNDLLQLLAISLLPPSQLTEHASQLADKSFITATTLETTLFFLNRRDTIRARQTLIHGFTPETSLEENLI